MRPAVHYYGEDSITHQWIECKGYSGLWAENITQAAARDILADALVRLRGSDLAVR
jgi:DNA polymerase bacteriophage-type